MASYAFAEWRDDPGEVVLIEEGEFTGIGRGRGRSVHRFPGGELVATSRDLELPTGATIGRWPLQGSVKEAVIAMRGHRVGDEVLPLAQRVSAIASIYGQTLGIDSLLRFTTARRCSAGAETAEGGPLAQEGEVPPPEATQAPR